MSWKKLLGATATAAGVVAGGPAGAAVAVGASALTGGSFGKDLGKKAKTRAQNVLAPGSAALVPAVLSQLPGVDLTPLVQFLATFMENFFGCAVQCPETLSAGQGAAAAMLLGLLTSAFHQGAKNVQKAGLSQK